VRYQRGRYPAKRRTPVFIGHLQRFRERKMGGRGWDRTKKTGWGTRKLVSKNDLTVGARRLTI